MRGQTLAPVEDEDALIPLWIRDRLQQYRVRNGLPLLAGDWLQNGCLLFLLRSRFFFLLRLDGCASHAEKCGD